MQQVSSKCENKTQNPSSVHYSVDPINLARELMSLALINLLSNSVSNLSASKNNAKRSDKF